jgi:poly-gamma-glutamate capsule biosynthesis protein CapA/YwtB (metallophosphatase superfamily)
MLYHSEGRSITVMLGGDVMLGRRLSVFTEPSFMALVEMLRNADLSFANLETTVRLPDEGVASISPGTYMTTPPELLHDLKWFGISMVSCANNHAFDYGEGSVLSTCRHLDAFGIHHAGSGANLTMARRPAYADTPKGRVGLIAATATFLPWSRAGEPRAEVAGRPGINPLRASYQHKVKPDDLAVLRRLAGELGFQKENARNRQHFFSDKEAPPDDGQEVNFLNARFVSGDSAGIESQADPADLADNLRWIAEARRQCDWLVVSIHSHEHGFAGSTEAARRSDLTEPADFVIEYARAAIDAGADIVVGHGSHTPLGVEIYHGKPILYGLGNLIFHNDTVDVLPSEAYERFDLGPGATPADFQDVRTAKDTKGHPGDRAFWENVVAECTFTDGALERIALHPIDQGYGRPRAQRGRPLLAVDDVADRVLSRVMALSTERGTQFSRDGNCAVYVADEKA